MKKLICAGIIALGIAAANAQVLTFEGLKNLEPINNFYNGGTGGFGSGPGPNYGISFTSDSLAVIATSAGGSGNFSGNPSGDTIAFFLTGAGDTMNVAAGFNTGFSFFYAAAIAGSVNVYSGLNGTGALLATLPLPVTPNPYNVWVPVGVAFGGTAESVVFAGSANYIGFDDVTIGSQTAGQVPDGGATATLLGLAMLGLSFVRRKLG